MDNAVQLMLAKYRCQTLDDYTNAIKEIIQEIALLGLWRGKFFEKAAFYGGTSLRILYGLNRFSEDLDFSLFKSDLNFDLTQYNLCIQKELSAFGFELEIVTKPKLQTNIVSAFIKAKTKIQFLNLKLPEELTHYLPKDQQLKIKMEVDIDPPSNFKTEAKILLQPIPFSVISYQLSEIFAEKIHAMLYRQWQLRVKGRDWYDFIWFVSQGIPVRISYLESRLRKSKQWLQSTSMNMDELKSMLRKKIADLDIDKAKIDIKPFIKDPDSIVIWSGEFFLHLVDQLKSIN